MTKKKKIIIGCSAAVAVVAVVLLLLVFVFDTFGLFTSEYRLNYDKYVTVGEYKGLKYDKIKVSVSDKEVQSQIKTNVAAEATTKSVKKGTVKDGDTINISYEGKVNGKTFDGGSAENTSITIGTTSMIDGFTDGLIGKKVGSTVKLNLKFPKNYSANTDLSNKKVVFTVTINSKQVTSTPKYNLAFVKKYTKYKTIKAYEKSVKKDLLANKKSEKKSEIKNTLWNQVVEDSKVKSYPEKQLAYEQEQITNQYKQMAESYGITWKKFLKNYLSTDSKSFNKQAKSYAKSMVKQKLVMYSIAKKESISVSKSEYKEYLSNLLTQAGFTEDSFKSQYGETIEEYAEENGYETNYLMDQVLDKVMEYGKEKSK